MKNVRIKKGALIGYGVAVEGDCFDAFGNPTKNSNPTLLETHLNLSALEHKEIAERFASYKNEHGLPKYGRVVLVELRAVCEIEPCNSGLDMLDLSVARFTGSNEK